MRSLLRPVLWLAGSLAPCMGCHPTPPPLEPSPPVAAPAPDEATPASASILPWQASSVSLDELARFPEPGWSVPREPTFSPSGKHLSFLASETGSDEMALWLMPVSGGEPRVLVRSADLVDAGHRQSTAEELRDERQRKRIRGVTEAHWAAEADALVLPAGGDVFVMPKVGAPVERVTRTDEPELDPKLSPDAARVGFVRGAELYVVDLGTRKERALTRGAGEGVTRGQSDFNGQEEFDEPSGWWWSPDGKRIAYLEVDERAVGTVPLLGYREGAPSSMQQRYPRAGRANPRVTLHVVDVATARSRRLELPPDVGDAPYLGRVRWLPDGTGIALQTLDRAQKRRHTLVFELGTEPPRARVIHRVEHPSSWVEFGELRPLSAHELLATVPHEGHDHLAVLDARVDLDRSAAPGPRLLTHGAWDVFTILEADAATNRAWCLANRDQRLGRQVLEIDLQSGAVTNRTPLAGTHAARVSARAGAMLDVHSALDRAPKAELIALGGARIGALPIGDDRARVEAMALRRPSLFEIDRGGVPVVGALLPPRRIVAGARHPLVLVVYGGPGIQTITDRWAPRLLWQHLADRGFFVMQVDNRGSGGRGHAFAAPIAGRLGEVELGDQIAALEHVLGSYPIDPERVGIYGHSYGGFLSALAMLEHPTRFAAGVAAAPVTDWSLYDTGYTERYLGTPTTNPAGYEGSTLARKAPALRGKLLLVHSLLDENVHFEHTARLVDALVTADRDFDLLLFPGERHGYRSPTARRHALRRIVDHLVEHLGTPPRAPALVGRSTLDSERRVE